MWTKQHHDIKRYGLPTTLHCINTDHDYWSINKDHKETSFYLDCVFTLDSVNIQSELCDRAIYPNLVVFLNPEKKKEVFVCFMHVFSMRGDFNTMQMAVGHTEHVPKCSIHLSFSQNILKISNKLKSWGGMCSSHKQTDSLPVQSDLLPGYGFLKAPLSFL